MDSKNIKSVLKTQAKVIAYVVICLVVIVIGISYSLYSDVKHNTTNQVVTAGDLKFTYTGGTEVTSTNEVCFNQTNETDAEKLTNCVYNVTVTNKGTLPGKYSLKLKSTSTNNTLDLGKLKVILKKSGTKVAGFPKTASSIISSGELASGTLNPNGTDNYSIQVFVDESIADTDDNKDIALQVEGIAEVNTINNNINPAK